jgi:hypothetical protein
MLDNASSARNEGEASMQGKVVKLVGALLLIWIGGLVSPAAADVVISNYPPANDFTSALIDEGYAVAAGFTMPAGPGYSLTSATVRIDADGPVTAFSAQLFGDGGAGPVAPALLTFTAPPIVLGTHDYTLVPNIPFVLQPSTTYWLVVRGDVPTVDQFGLSWIGSAPGIIATGVATSNGYRQDTSDPPTTVFAANGAQPTYRIEGIPPVVAVPTLGGWGLLALVVLLALAGLAIVRRS